MYDEYIDVLIQLGGARAERAERAEDPKALLTIKGKLEWAFEKKYGLED